MLDKMDTTTHEKFAAAMMRNAGVSDINMKLIKGVNHDIDNGPAYVMAMSNFFDRRAKLNQRAQQPFLKNPYDLFGIVNGSHRQHGHDLLSGMFIAAQNARALGLPVSKGMLPVFAHYMADNVSNKMVARMGSEGRNLFEALFNFQTRRNQSKHIF